MTPLLEVLGLSRRFGGLQAVDDLSLRCGDAEILGIIGPNGAGKTTAINVISGFIAPTVGRVRFRGQDVTGCEPHMLARLGLVRTFQATTVFAQQTVWENARRGAFPASFPGLLKGIFAPRSGKTAHAVDTVVDQLLERFGLAVYAGDKAGDLPYGLQKTLGMVIALAAQPRLIMLDEPVAGLNHEEAEQVRTMIKQVNALGIAVVVIDHNMRFMTGLCDRIVVMHHGKEIAHGLPATVLADAAVIDAYLGKVNEHAAP